MSIFNSIIEEHESLKAKAKSEAEAAEAAKNEAKFLFISDFHKLTETVALPILEEFRDNAIDYGFPAEIQIGTNSESNPYITLRFQVVKNRNFSNDSKLDCTFTLTGIIQSQEVEHAYHFDYPPKKIGCEKNGPQKNKYKILSINENVLNRELRELFSQALQRHDSQS